MVSKETQQEYDIATVKLLLFSYNIYLFNVLFLSYKLSFVFVHENIQKRQSTVRRSDISLLFISYSLGLREKLFASLLAFIPNFSFFFFHFHRTTMWINEHRRCFNDRSIHTMNASCLFLYYYLAVRNNPLCYAIWVLSSLVGYEKLYIDLGEATRNREIVWLNIWADIFQVIEIILDPRRFIRSARNIVFPFPFKNL